MNEPDPILLSVFARAFKSLTDEMSISLQKTTRSPILCEAKDSVTGVYDGHGNMLEQTENLPILSFSLGPVCKYILQYFGDDIHPGDVIFHNDVLSMGNQNNDLAVFKPIFFDDDLVAWSACKGHQADIGGAVAGGYNPGATEVWQKALRIPPVKVYDKGTLRKDVWDLIFANIRFDMVQQDMRAQIGSCVGERRMLHLLLRHEYLCDSAGPGRWRGGLGVETEFEIGADDTQLVAFGDGDIEPAFGLCGGGNGSLNTITLRFPDGKEHAPRGLDLIAGVPKGTRYHQRAGGGGGYGNPHDRSAEQVAREVRNGITSSGVARAAVDEAVQYAAQRKQFGKTINRFQAIQVYLAEMGTDLEAATHLVHYAAWLKDNDRPHKKEAAMAKLFATERAVSICDKATRILGSYGYAMEFAAQRHFRDIRFTLYGGGTSADTVRQA